MHHRSAAASLSLALVAATLLVGCGTSNATSPSTTSTNATSPPSHARPPLSAHVIRVQISNFAFSPATVHVAAGSSVIWTNKDSTPHNIASDTDAWAVSPSFGTDGHYTRVFAKPGKYAYHCGLHSFMRGTVIVSK